MMKTKMKLKLKNKSKRKSHCDRVRPSVSLEHGMPAETIAWATKSFSA